MIKINMKTALGFILVMFLLIWLQGQCYACENEHYVAYNYYDVSEQEMWLLERIVSAESRGEDLYGQELVVEVILNRIDSENFPDNLYDVLTQKKAFTSYLKDRHLTAPVTEQTILAIDNVFERGVQHKNMIAFNGLEVDNTWAKYLMTHGNHKFYTE